MPSFDFTRRQMLIGAAAMSVLGLASGPARAAGATSLVVAMSYAPKYFNPNYDFDGANYYTLPNLYSTLVHYDATGAIIGDLAESWDVSDDGRVYTFTIAAGVTFSDGKPLTADDVVFSVQSILEHNGYAKGCFNGMETVEAVDPVTVRFTLAAPNLSFLDQLSQRYGWVVLPKHVYEGTDPRTNPANVTPIGSGPFKLTDFVSGSYVGMEANPAYFKGAPKLENLYFRFYPDMSAATTALRAGEVDFLASSPSFDAIPQLEAAGGAKVDLVGGAPFLLLWLGFNLAKKPFDDLRVRQAIAHAIDREQINTLVYGNRLVTCHSPLLTANWAHDAGAAQPLPDLDRANALLDEAGLKRGADGIRFSMRYTAFRGAITGGREAGEVIRQQLAAVGIDVKVEFYDFAVFAEMIMKNRDYDMTWAGGPHGPDPQVFGNYVKTGGNRNSMGYSDPEVDAAFAEAARAPSREAAMPALQKIQARVVADLPRISVVEWRSPYVLREGLEGFWWQEGAAGQVPAESYRLVN